jgi:hypothetical protein
MIAAADSASIDRGAMELSQTHDFLVFVNAAKRLLAAADDSLPIGRFLDFIREAKRVEIQEQPLQQPPTAQFEGFVKRSLPLVVAEIKRRLPLIAERAVLAERWLTPHDLLSVGGFTYIENYYTALMSWALDPDTHPASATRRQRAWMAAIGFDEGICGETACVPTTQLVTGDGIPDLLMRFEKSTIVVEAKTGSAEHNAPSGKPQTFAYLDAVRETLGLPLDHDIRCVFITPDRRSAENPEAKATTFVEFVFALAGALETSTIGADSQPTRAAYAMLFTHFLTQAAPVDIDARELIQRVAIWSRDSDWDDDNQTCRRINDLLKAATILMPEQKQ